MEEELLNQHKKIYLGAINDIMNNNNDALVLDLLSLFEGPPLETMDTIKQKFLSLAKNFELIIDMEKLDKALSLFRQNMQKEVKVIAAYRKEELEKYFEQKSKTYEGEIRFFKKEMTLIDKVMRKKLKEEFIKNQEEFIEKENTFFTSFNNSIDLQNQVQTFFKKHYLKQLLEEFDMKLLVKNTTLLNGISEQTERYLFTKENSHLFD